MENNLEKKVAYAEPLSFRLAQTIRSFGYDCFPAPHMSDVEILEHRKTKRFLYTEDRYIKIGKLSHKLNQNKPELKDYYFTLEIYGRENIERLKKLAEKIQEEYQESVNSRLACEKFLPYP